MPVCSLETTSYSLLKYLHILLGLSWHFVFEEHEKTAECGNSDDTCEHYPKNGTSWWCIVFQFLREGFLWVCFVIFTFLLKGRQFSAHFFSFFDIIRNLKSQCILLLGEISKIFFSLSKLFSLSVSDSELKEFWWGLNKLNIFDIILLLFKLCFLNHSF